MAGGLGHHDAASRPPAESAAHPPRRAGPSDEALDSDNSHDATLLTGRGTSTPPADHSQTADGAGGDEGGGGDYDAPDRYANLDELSAQGPVDRGQRPSLDQTRGWHRGAQEKSGGGDVAAAAAAVVVSRRLTQLYTHSYLVFFALMGVLARLGLTALTRYVDTPVLFTTIWANFGGSLIMGFLAEDRMLFRHEWGGTTTQQQPQPQKRDEDDAEHGRQAATTTAAGGVDAAAAKKAHLACKKTIPLYVGLTTGFCGSFTSFSTFMRDVFLATSNDMVAPGTPPPAPPPRSGGYSFMALLAVVITTVALSLSGLVFGAHCAAATARLTPSLPYRLTRNVVDPLFVVVGWGSWLGAVLLAALPPGGHDAWRGQAVFALVFAPLGCLARFYLALYLNGRKAAFPVGTFAANVLGSAVLGMAWDVAHLRGGGGGGVVGCQVLQGVEDGFCGCLTTVSTWVAELAALKRRSAYVYGAASILVSFAVMVLIMGGLRWTDGWAALQC